MRWTLLLVIFISSCAQVGTLDGGPIDGTAPQPIENKVSPPNQSIFFKGNQIEIPFDEFIRLNKPSENLIVVPPDIKAKATIKGKSLIISWDDTLSVNTTYAFYLNGLVKDTREGNDSLMTYVFSTGSAVDSLRTFVQVVDAFTNEALKKVTVGLYSKFNDTLRPTYFAETNENGFAAIKYLKPGSFDLVAFVDNNRDLKLTADENRGFIGGKINIQPGKADTFSIRLFQAKQKSQIRTFRFNAPGSFIIGATDSLDKAEIRLNGMVVDESSKYFFNPDSLLIYSDELDTNSFQLIVNNEHWTDTTKLRITKRDLVQKLNLLSIKDNQKHQLSEEGFLLSLRPKSLDSSKIYLRLLGDSLLFPAPIRLHGALLNLSWGSSLPFGVYELIFPPGSINTIKNVQSDTLKLSVERINPESRGTISVSIPSNNQNVVLELIQAKRVVARKSISDSSFIAFRNLPPGEYSFRAIQDENGNELWDTGNIKFGRQAEQIIYYNKAYTLRPNWEIEVELLREKQDGK
jgi:uncharacterized protein (DUF2141 family)